VVLMIPTPAGCHQLFRSPSSAAPRNIDGVRESCFLSVYGNKHSYHRRGCPSSNASASLLTDCRLHLDVALNAAPSADHLPLLIGISADDESGSSLQVCMRPGSLWPTSAPCCCHPCSGLFGGHRVLLHDALGASPATFNFMLCSSEHNCDANPSTCWESTGCLRRGPYSRHARFTRHQFTGARVHRTSLQPRLQFARKKNVTKSWPPRLL